MEKVAKKPRSSRPAVILASSSPRRRELLSGLGLSFRIMTPDISEDPQPGESAEAFVKRAAEEKAQAAVEQISKGPLAKRKTIIIAADTIVVLGDEVLGKPIDEEEARGMLADLSGNTHQVLSGLCVLARNEQGEVNMHSTIVSTSVTFRTLSSSEINRYIQSGEPMDKAGAYGIQGGANYMVQSIQGSYTNVVGLPLSELVDLLQLVNPG